VPFSSATATKGQRYILKEAEPIHTFIAAKWGASLTLLIVENIREQRKYMRANLLVRLYFQYFTTPNFCFSPLNFELISSTNFIGLIDILGYHSQSCNKIWVITNMRSHGHHHSHGHSHGYGKRDNSTPTPGYFWQWLWGCCGCGAHAGMSTFIENCPGCSHTRCVACPMESVKIRSYGRGGGSRRSRMPTTANSVHEKAINKNILSSCPWVLQTCLAVITDVLTV
jgi:hypothetical protein